MPRWFRYGFALAVMLALAVVYIDRRDLPGLYRQVQQSNAEVKRLADSVAELEREKARLEYEVRQLRDDPVEREAQIRHRMGLVRPGETIYQID